MEGEPILSNTAATMEVHHHAHTKRKTFRHYLFEFFMLFFAVFCGFLAEYFLEHTIEHQREKQFITSMITDLKDDTGRISKIVDYNNKQLKGLDSMIRLLYRIPTAPDSVNKVHSYYRNYALNYERVVFNTRTLTQLKNSGGMRLIRNQSVSDSIMSYDAGIVRAELQFEVVRDGWKEETEASFQVFDLADLYINGLFSDGIQRKLLTNDVKTLRAYASRLFMFAGVIRGYTNDINTQKAQALRLIQYLEKQYHLD